MFSNVLLKISCSVKSLFCNDFINNKKEYDLICGKIIHTFKCLKYIFMSNSIDLDIVIYIHTYIISKIFDSGYFLGVGLCLFISFNLVIRFF